MERGYFVEFQQTDLECNTSDFIVQCLERISRRFVMPASLLESQFINDSSAHCLNIVLKFLNNNLLIFTLHKFIVPVALKQLRLWPRTASTCDIGSRHYVFLTFSFEKRREHLLLFFLLPHVLLSDVHLLWWLLPKWMS